MRGTVVLAGGGILGEISARLFLDVELAKGIAVPVEGFLSYTFLAGAPPVTLVPEG